MNINEPFMNINDAGTVGSLSVVVVVQHCCYFVFVISSSLLFSCTHI